MKLSRAGLLIAKHRFRIVATLAMLVLFHLGSRLPFPGLPELLLQYRDGPMFSLFGSGIFAWMMAVAVLELSVLASRRVRSKGGVEAGHVNPFSMPVVLLSLPFAVFQTYSSIVGMWAFLLPGSAPSLLDFAVVATTASAALLATMLIATVIDRFGWGFGFWTLVFWLRARTFVPDVFDLVTGLRFRLNAEQLIFQKWEIWLQLLLVAAAACLAAAFVRLLSDDGEGTPLHAVWPFFMAALLSTLFFQFLYPALSALFDPADAKGFWGPRYLGFRWTAETFLTLVFVWLYYPRGVAGQAFWLRAFVAGAMVAISHATYLAFTSFGGTAVNNEPLKFVIAAALLRHMSVMHEKGKAGETP